MNILCKLFGHRDDSVKYKPPPMPKCKPTKGDKKLDKYHYHEFIHATSIVREMIDSHLLGHHLGEKYSEDLAAIDDLLINLYNKVSNDSDELWPSR